jgi:hypothetical protein
MVAGPVLFVVFWGWRLDSPARWLELPFPLLLYLIPMWFLGFVVIPIQTVRRWLRHPPLQQISNHSHCVDFTQALGHRPYGQGKKAMMARLPFNQIFQVEFAERTYRLPNLPAAWDGLTLLHLTDLHLCGTPDLSFYEHVMDKCAAESVDLLLITGDVLDSDQHYHWIAPVLRRLRWREGAYAVLGNHDSWLDVPRIHQEMNHAGVEMLGGRWTQRIVRGERLLLFGNELPWIPPLPDLSACPAEGFRLCLSHSPDQLLWARRRRTDLMLAGHNHGGQIRFPLLGPMLVPSRYSRRYDCGAFYESPTLLHVGRGLGGTYPLRYNCLPEVTRLVLRKA